MRDVVIAITAASYSGNKGAAAMLQSSIRQLHDRYGERLNINLMSVYPGEDRKQLPWDFIRVVPCKPERLLFIAFPLAILYFLFRWCSPIRRLLLKEKVLKAYYSTDCVLDEAGISFEDSRGFVMNTYAFVCAAVPLLMGVPVIKYSQAMGTFKKPWNRFLAKWILPKLRLICARGRITQENLRGIGVEKNVKLCADGAFTMADDDREIAKVEWICSADPFYTDADERLVGVAVSSVVERKCSDLNIDYVAAIVDFIDRLNKEGYKVLLIANAARIHSQKPRNNDLMVCDRVYAGVTDKSMVRWYHEEMTAEQIRGFIGKCCFLVASRFHAMIGALQRKVPVLLVGWSHKYQEVLDFFGLGSLSADFSSLSADRLMERFRQMLDEESEIRRRIDENYDSVMASSRQNIAFAGEEIDAILAKPYRYHLLDYRDPDRYMGAHLVCRRGYAADESIRENAASGGMVTAYLCHLLRTGKIDGAWVTRTKVEDGQVGYETLIATTEEEIRSCSSSIYMSIPMMKHIDLVRQFPGRVAVVMVPCMVRGLDALLQKDEALQEKIVLKLGLFCSGNHSPAATALSVRKAGVSLENVWRFYYRRGHWRGQSSVIYSDGSEKTFSYSKILCAYKNAYYFEQGSCMYCQDHFACAADISFGDIWLKSMKREVHKTTCCVIRSQQALDWYREMVEAGELVDFHVSDRDILRGQKRALVFKFACAKAKKPPQSVHLDTKDPCRWNHHLAFWLAERNRRVSEEHPERLEMAPSWLIYCYMCFIRVLLSF